VHFIFGLQAGFSRNALGIPVPDSAAPQAAIGVDFVDELKPNLNYHAFCMKNSGPLASLGCG
jgi:hypothetical protein